MTDKCFWFHVCDLAEPQFSMLLFHIIGRLIFLKRCYCLIGVLIFRFFLFLLSLLCLTVFPVFPPVITIFTQYFIFLSFLLVDCKSSISLYLWHFNFNYSILREFVVISLLFYFLHCWTKSLSFTLGVTAQLCSMNLVIKSANDLVV